MKSLNSNKLIIISAPSGAGKTSVVAEIVKKSNCASVVTVTTRNKRANEIDGVDYHFVTVDVFNEMINNSEFIEYANVYGNLYGSTFKGIENVFNANKTPILIVDIQGADSIRNNYTGNICSIFIMPPSIDELESRLNNRNENNSADIKIRIKNASREIEESEKFDYAIINDDFNKTVTKIKEIILKTS